MNSEEVLEQAYKVIRQKFGSRPLAGSVGSEVEVILHILFTRDETDLSRHLTFRAEPFAINPAAKK